MSQFVYAKILITGLVQGIGFRPYVFKLAQRYGLSGSVANTAAGVEIELFAEKSNISAFSKNLEHSPPPQAFYQRFQLSFPPNPAEKKFTEGFKILESRAGCVRSPLPPDLAICESCKSELSQQGNTRNHYAAISCAQCGPRFSILNTAPYDRRNTSMHTFTLCEYCQREFSEVENRRFHAETIACEKCGPLLYAHCEKGVQENTSNQPLSEINAKGNVSNDYACVQALVKVLKRGELACVKGLGGFHLLADAGNDQAVNAIRQLKRRPHKALALLAKDVTMVRAYATVNANEEVELESALAPIVLLSKPSKRSKQCKTLSPLIAPGQSHLGFCLAYTGLHHMLMSEFDTPLVFTSANGPGEAQCYEDAQAALLFKNKVGIIVGHNRKIQHRCDDSVLKKVGRELVFFRRARGVVPSSVPLPVSKNQIHELDTSPNVLEQAENKSEKLSLNILALGAETSSSFSLLNESGVVVSGYLGDLKNYQQYQDYCQQLKAFSDLHKVQADYLIVDKHPDYASTQYGQELAKESGLTLLSVQHHHAHMASCLLENGIANDEDNYLGIVLDGSGYGEDNTSWGAEWLFGSYQCVERLAHFKTIPLPGGDLASRQPWRMLFSYLNAANMNDFLEKYSTQMAIEKLKDKPLQALQVMLEKNIACPLASSAGRLFDAVAAALDLCFEEQSYEGQAAMELESLAYSAFAEEKKVYSFTCSSRELDWHPMWPALFDDLAAGLSRSVIAARFHRTLIAGIYALTRELLKHYPAKAIALSGGVFQNALLLEGLQEKLEAAGYRVLCHRQLPANDGGISAGQAAVAWSQLTH